MELRKPSEVVEDGHYFVRQGEKSTIAKRVSDARPWVVWYTTEGSQFHQDAGEDNLDGYLQVGDKITLPTD